MNIKCIKILNGKLMCDFKPPRFTSELRERLSQPGVAIGLAWTSLGGEIMYIEATQMTGDGKLTLTGQLGDVMKESANLAMNWLRSNVRRVSCYYVIYMNNEHSNSISIKLNRTRLAFLNR